MPPLPPPLSLSPSIFTDSSVSRILIGLDIEHTKPLLEVKVEVEVEVEDGSDAMLLW
jgi:hypothetical protein